MLNKMVLQQCRTTNWLVLEQIQSISSDLFKVLHAHLPNSRYWEGDMGLGPPNQSIKNMFSISNLKILKWWFFGQSTKEKNLVIEIRDQINNLSAYCMIEVWIYLSFQDVWWKVLTWPNLLQMTAGQPTSTAKDSKLHITILPFTIKV